MIAILELGNDENDITIKSKMVFSKIYIYTVKILYQILMKFFKVRGKNQFTLFRSTNGKQ